MGIFGIRENASLAYMIYYARDFFRTPVGLVGRHGGLSRWAEGSGMGLHAGRLLREIASDGLRFW
jgi:hypothetical protein